MRTAILLSVVLTGCGGGSRPAPEKPLGAAEHLTEAQRHDRVAAQHEDEAEVLERQGATPVLTCIDQPLAGVPYSGTEPLQVMRPCWRTDDIETHRRAARQNSREAADHRRAARELRVAEQQACAGLGEEEIAHGPFWHVDDIAVVERIDEGGELRGARVVFLSVSGLSPAWLERAIACEQARAAVIGYDQRASSTSPATLPHVKAEVRPVPGGIAVMLRSPDPLVAAQIYGRASYLLSGHAAHRN